MTDLFGTPVLPGVTTASEVVTAEEEQALIAAIDDAGLAPFRFQGWEGKRLTASYGWTYDFATGRLGEARRRRAGCCRSGSALRASLACRSRTWFRRC